MRLPKIYTDNDISLQPLKDKNIAVIGYGNQGRAHALNLLDSGFSVKIGLRSKSKSFETSKYDGIEAFDIEYATKWADIICILIPDQEIERCFNKSIKPFLKNNQTLLFAHGYSIHYKVILPPKNVNIIMVAPSGPGSQVRSKYKSGSGIPNLVAIHQDYTCTSKKLVLAYSKAIGGSKIGTFFSTFKEETETDLFGEQVLLTGGLPKLIQATFEILVESGYSPVTAWFVSYYELKSMMDMFYDKGFEYMNNAISDTAEYGGMTRGQRIISTKVKDEMKAILTEIQSGKFFNEWTEVSKKSTQKLNNLRNHEKDERINSTNKVLISRILKDKNI
jgi:ketol-acid reductoisomerase